MKKIIAMLLAVLMLVGMLAGCQSGTSTTETTGGTNETTANDSNSGDDEEIPTLIWYQVGGGEPSNLDSWTETVNAYLEEKIGVHLELHIVSWGDWGDRSSMIVQTNEDYDLMFCDMSNYYTYVDIGAFADLTDLIAETPGLTDLIPETYIDACRVDGKLYAIPAYKDSSMTNFFVWTKEYVDEYFPEYTEAHDLASCTEGLKAIKEGTGETPVLLNKDGISCVTGNLYDSFGSGLSVIGVSYYDDSGKVVSVFEQEDVMEQLKILYSWMEDGLINADAATLSEASGMCAMSVAQGWPSAAQGWGDGRGTEVVVSQFGDSVVSNDTIMGSLTAISNSSEHKTEALKLLELVNTDSKLRDMLAYGEEGVNFEYVEEDGVTKVNKLNSDWTGAAYTQGTFMNLSVTTGTSADTYSGEVASQNENAISSVALGFYFDTTNVADQVAAVKATWETFKSVLYTGTGDPETIVAEMIEAMRADGLDDIIAEAQTQLDAYLGK